MLAGLVLLAAPFLAYWLYDHANVMAHVPSPLTAEIEYRLEQNWAADGSGVGWAGIIVYRLDQTSSRWAREQGMALTAALPGGPANWSSTPIDYSVQYKNWHRDENLGIVPRFPPGVSDYVGQYGFDTSVDRSVEADVNATIQTAGAFYSYVTTESVTVVDPIKGKVYYFYTPRWPD